MNHNDSIGCTVPECKYHAQNSNYCTLNKIQVTKHTPEANSVQCTDCGSFESNR
ncbi:DUF1540 domain-containing protein [Clostridium botulinum]|nr:DUF1540 domain-containing protein [Clostridium botulinum]